jgi:hypothetical protein
MSPEHGVVYPTVVHGLGWGQPPFDDEFVLEWSGYNFTSVLRKWEVRFCPVTVIGSYHRRTLFKKGEDILIVWVDVW